MLLMWNIDRSNGR